ncbi:MAG: hypothetical protein FWF08_03055 [Oscillospiraceae bacterium]|nr:hypothetical protein [Oscillospiraceae bacterium]
MFGEFDAIVLFLEALFNALKDLFAFISGLFADDAEELDPEDPDVDPE